MSLASLVPPFAAATPARPAGVRPLAGGGVLSVAGVVILLLALVAASVWQAAANDAAYAAARMTRSQRSLTTDIVLAALGAETSQRGYLLSLNPQYLAPLSKAEADLPQLVARAEAIWPEDPRLLLLGQSVTAKLAELRWTVTLAGSGRLADALSIMRTNAGLTNMMVIRQVTDQLSAELDRTLLRLVSAANRGSRLLVAIDVAGLLMMFGLAGLITLGLRGYLAGLRAAEDRTRKAYDLLERNNDQLDATVRKRTAALTAANDEIQRFAYIVSHDLRAPLVNIMGFTSELEHATAVLFRDGAAPGGTLASRAAAQEDVEEALRFIKLSSSKMDRLINAILRLSREGRRVLVAERLDMEGLLGGLAETMRHQAESKGAVVTVGEVPGLIADRIAVEQVFGNIVENALKYLDPGRPGVIGIVGAAQGRMVRIEVSDNGRGIAAQDYQRVFDLFRRAGDQSVPGEGIGLAHVRALVRRLGGSVDLRSELGAGSTFTVRLPAVAAYEEDAAA